jgi:hypothetical protein
MIDYYLAEEPAGELTLEILDASGKLVRAFSSEGPGGEEAGGEPRWTRAGFEGVVTPRLPKDAGMHRFIWDLRYPGAWAAEPRRAGSYGPLAAPGTYQARLSVGDWSRTRSFEVLIDPRVAEDGVTQEDLEAQLAFNLRLVDMMSDARKAAQRVGSVREELEKRTAEIEDRDVSNRAQRLDLQLASVEAQLVTEQGRYPQPMLIEQLGYLYGMTSGADQKLGADAYARFHELTAEFSGHVAEIERLLTTDLAELNGLLRDRGIAPVTAPMSGSPR